MKFNGKKLEMYFDGEIDDFVGAALIELYNDPDIDGTFDIGELLYAMEIVGFTWERDDDALDFFDDWVENETDLVESTDDGDYVFTGEMPEYVIICKFLN